jgi:hypothetical protein
MQQIHDRYKRTFDVMKDDLAVINWRAFTELNIDGFVKGAPGVYLLAHTSGHDQNMVNPPYFIGAAEDVRAALYGQVKPEDPELLKHAEIGRRWFRVYYAKNAGELEARRAEIEAQWSAVSPAGHGHGTHGSGAVMEHKGEDG